MPVQTATAPTLLKRAIGFFCYKDGTHIRPSNTPCERSEVVIVNESGDTNRLSNLHPCGWKSEFISDVQHAQRVVSLASVTSVLYRLTIWCGDRSLQKATDSPRSAIPSDYNATLRVSAGKSVEYVPRRVLCMDRMHIFGAPQRSTASTHTFYCGSLS